MPVQDQFGRWVDVGDTVNIVGKVTQIGGDPDSPTVTIQTVWPAVDGNLDTVGPVDAKQVSLSN